MNQDYNMIKISAIKFGFDTNVVLIRDLDNPRL